MKFGHMVKYKGEYYPAGADVPVGNVAKVEVTNDVPDGALDTNKDGSVNAYDADGNVVGTVDAESVAELQEQAGEEFSEEDAEQDKPKRGRKSKEE